jgi:hypothetical protein
MKILMNGQVKQHEGIQEATERSARIALIVGFAVLGIGGVYFVVLYLLSQ